MLTRQTPSQCLSTPTTGNLPCSKPCLDQRIRTTFNTKSILLLLLEALSLLLLLPLSVETVQPTRFDRPGLLARMAQPSQRVIVVPLALSQSSLVNAATVLSLLASFLSTQPRHLPFLFLLILCRLPYQCRTELSLPSLENRTLLLQAPTLSLSVPFQCPLEPPALRRPCLVKLRVPRRTAVSAGR